MAVLGSPWQSYIAFHWVCLKIGYLLIVSHSICTYGYLRPSCGLPFFSAARNHQKPSFFSHSPYHFVGIPWYPHDIPMVSNPMGIQCTLRMRSTKSELWELFRDAFDKLQAAPLRRASDHLAIPGFWGFLDFLDLPGYVMNFQKINYFELLNFRSTV